MAHNDYVPKALMQDYTKIFELLTVSNSRDIFPRIEAFMGTRKHINSAKSTLVVRMRRDLLREPHQFRKSDFARLVKGVTPEIARSIDRVMDKIAMRIREMDETEALNSIGNAGSALAEIDRVRRKSKKIAPPDTTQSAPKPRAASSKVISKPDLRPIIVSPIQGLPHDTTKKAWNVHRSKMLYPVYVRIAFHEADGRLGGLFGEYVAYLPYGVHLSDSVCVVEYETRAGTTSFVYVIFPSAVPKVGKSRVVKSGNVYGEAWTIRRYEHAKFNRLQNYEDFEDQTEALLLALNNRLLSPGDSLSHEWFVPSVFKDGFYVDKKSGCLARNNPSALEAGRVAWDRYSQSTGEFTEAGTYSVKFQDVSAFSAALTNLGMISYRAVQAYQTGNVLPSSLAIHPQQCIGRGVSVVERRGLKQHTFSCLVGSVHTHWEPLWDGICLISDDTDGLIEVSVQFQGGNLSDVNDGLRARHFTVRQNRFKQIANFTVFCVGTRNGYFMAFIPTPKITHFSSIYAVAASVLVARVNEIMEGYTYTEPDTRQALRIMVSRRVEHAYREFAAESSAAAAVVNFGLNCYNGMFSPDAREFIRGMVPDYVSILTSSLGFMRESIVRTADRKLALTAAVGLPMAVLTYGLGRDLTTLTNMHPNMGFALASMVRGGLEEAWLNSVSWVNPGLGLALRLVVAATEFARDVSKGVTPYASAVHSLAAILPPALSAPIHIIYNGARGYIDSFGEGQATLGLWARVAAIAGICIFAFVHKFRTESQSAPALPDPAWDEDEEQVDSLTPLSELFRPAKDELPAPAVVDVPVLQKVRVGELTGPLIRSGVEAGISELTLPWKPLLERKQKGDTLHVSRNEIVDNEKDLLNFGCQRSSTWLSWGGSRYRLPFHFGNSLVNLVGGVYRRLLVPAMRVVGRDNTPQAWEPPAGFQINAGLSAIINNSSREFATNPQFWFNSWLNSRTVSQSRKYSEELRRSQYVDVLARANSQASYKVNFFVKQEPTFNPSIRLIFPIEPLAEMAISPFVKCMEQHFVSEMKFRLNHPLDRQSIFTGGFDSLEKGAAWATIKGSFNVNYVFAVDCTSWDSFVPGALLAQYRKLYPSEIQPVVHKQLINPSHFEASKNGKFYMRALRHTCTQLSGSPDTYILNSIANAHILENFLCRYNLSGQSMICGDDSLLTVATNVPQEISQALIRHFAEYGLSAKVGYYELDDPSIDFCSGHFTPVKQRVDHQWIDSYAWIPNPIKFISKAFVIKTVSREDLDQALSRYLMTTYQMFKYTPDLMYALVPRRCRYQLHTYAQSFPDVDYEFELKFGRFVSGDRWQLPQGRPERVQFAEICQYGDYDAVFEQTSFFFTQDFEHALPGLRCPTLLPDTRAKYIANVLHVFDSLPPVYEGHLTYSSILACNPVFQLAVAEMDEPIISVRKHLERSPYHTMLLSSPDTKHLNFHMAYTDRVNLFMQINSCAVPRVFVDPTHYLSALGGLGASTVMRAVNRHVQVGESGTDGIEYEETDSSAQDDSSEPTGPRGAGHSPGPTGSRGAGLKRSPEVKKKSVATTQSALSKPAQPKAAKRSKVQEPLKIEIKTKEETQGLTSLKVKKDDRSREEAPKVMNVMKVQRAPVSKPEDEPPALEYEDGSLVAEDRVQSANLNAPVTYDSEPDPRQSDDKKKSVRTLKAKMFAAEVGEPDKLAPMSAYRDLDLEADNWDKVIRGNTDSLLRSARPQSKKDAREIARSYLHLTNGDSAYKAMTGEVKLLMSQELSSRVATYRNKKSEQCVIAQLLSDAFQQLEREMLPRASQAEGKGIKARKVLSSVAPRETAPSYTIQLKSEHTPPHKSPSLEKENLNTIQAIPRKASPPKTTAREASSPEIAETDWQNVEE